MTDVSTVDKRGLRSEINALVADVKEWERFADRGFSPSPYPLPQGERGFWGRALRLSLQAERGRLWHGLRVSLQGARVRESTGDRLARNGQSGDK